MCLHMSFLYFLYLFRGFGVVKFRNDICQLHNRNENSSLLMAFKPLIAYARLELFFLLVRN